MNKYRATRIFGAGVIGAYIGSFTGIAALGTAISGILPIGALTAYLVYLWTRNRSMQDASETASGQKSATVTVPTSEQASSKVPEQVTHDAIPVLIRFFVASWNLLMKGLVAARVMPLFKRTPWLLVILIMLLIVVITPVGIFILITALFVIDKEPKAANNFMI